MDALGGDHQPHLARPGRARRGADRGFQRIALGAAEPGRVQHDAGARALEADRRPLARGGADRGNRYVLCHAAPDRPAPAACHCFSASAFL